MTLEAIADHDGLPTENGKSKDITTDQYGDIKFLYTGFPQLLMNQN